MSFYTLLTAIGAADFINAQAGGTTVPFTHLALGDGNGAAVIPLESMTELVHEVHRVPINSTTPDAENANWLVIEAMVPMTVGGWSIREIGLIGGSGPGDKLLAVGNFPETYKPVLSDGSGRDLIVRMIVQLGNASTVQLTVDPSVTLATLQSVRNAVEAHEAEADPHSQYLTKWDAAQTYKPILSALNKGGDTMTGPLTLAGNPTAPLHAASKQYVDSLMGSAADIVRKPTNTTPAANTTGFSISGSLQAGTYYSLYGVSQAAAQFQISTVADFSTTVRDVTLGAVSSWAITPSLNSSTQYYWRVRYKDAENTWSAWSAPTLFTTGAVIITQPTLTSPAGGATGVAALPTLTSSAFAVTGGADTHASSRWQVATDSAFGNVVADTGVSTLAKTSYTLPSALAYGTTYYARVMHTGVTYGSSSWSSTVGFTTLTGQVNTPTMTSPASGSTGVSTSPSLSTSAFSTSGAADTHVSTDWEIRTADNGGGTLVWSSLDNASNKVSILASGLSNNSTYYARARHKGTTFGYGQWSSSVSFTTAAAAGEAYYTTPGTYTLTIPAGVTSVCAAVTPGNAGGAPSESSVGTLTAKSGFGVTTTARTSFSISGAKIVKKFGAYFACASDGVWKSTDKVNWTKQSIPFNLNPATIIATTNRVLFITQDWSGSTCTLFKTTDGNTWSEIAGHGINYGNIDWAYSGSRLCLIGQETSGVRLRYSDTEGDTWSSSGWSPLYSKRIMHDGAKFVIVGYRSDNGNSSATSVDAVSWTTGTTYLAADEYQVVKLNSGVYVGINSTYRRIIVSSPNDPHTWAEYTCDSRFSTPGLTPIQIATNGTHVIIATQSSGSGVTRVQLTTDGVTWAEKSVGSPAVYALNLSLLDGAIELYGQNTDRRIITLATTTYSGQDSQYTGGTGLFNVYPNATANGSYGADVVAWKNNIAVTPGANMTVKVGQNNGAVRVIWGTGRSFPSNAA